MLAAGAKNLPEVAARFKQAFENDLRALYDGKQLSQRQLDTLKKSLGRVDSFVPATRETPAAPEEYTLRETSAAIDVAAKACDKDGFAPASAIGKELLYSYSIPQDRQYNVAELIAGLRLARKGGLSQSQVNKVLAESNV